ncbi:S1 family peptidase [Kitasatospora xanthocidica]|uniref:S1 family peptidase n=1 Tax=Kitasatospora xanthocidica TaxID=83382 RepID=A0A373A201_9ACTN|nr:trypsin-like serine protease [Kitasatospora xanthocidica]RGD62178.1 S1 family peptidase [Kitasatospora xanthocidica]
MSRNSSPRNLRAGALATVLAAGALTTLATPPAGAVVGDAAANGTYAYTALLTIGDNLRACTGTLVDRSWVLTAASCFSDDPAQPQALAAGAPKWKTTATIGRTDLTTGAGKTAEISELVPRADRDLVMARLATPVDGIAPLRVATAAPAAGQTLRVPGYGRTKDEWAPLKLHSGAFSLDTVSATGIGTTGTGGAAVCKGDTGAPVVREVNGKAELVAVASRSWQGGCLGVPATETRTGAFNSRVDNIAGWVQQVRAKAIGWKTQALVRSDANLYLASRLYDGSWTPYEDVQAAAGNIGGVRAVSSAGINGDTHVIALGGDGHLHHAVHNLDGGWGQKFVDINTTVADLGNITQVTIAPVGNDLHVVVVADGILFHSMRSGNGQWSSFKVVTEVTGPLNGITSISAGGAAGGELHIAAVSGGKVYHTRRNAAGSWSPWGSVAEAAGATAPVSAVAVTRQGDDLNLAVIASDGQYHTLRHASGSWQPVNSLGSVLGNVTGTGISAATVDTDAVFAVTTNDNKILLTNRHADGNWTAPESLDLTAIPGNHTGTVITSSL